MDVSGEHVTAYPQEFKQPTMIKFSEALTFLSCQFKNVTGEGTQSKAVREADGRKRKDGIKQKEVCVPVYLL